MDSNRPLSGSAPAAATAPLFNAAAGEAARGVFRTSGAPSAVFSALSGSTDLLVCDAFSSAIAPVLTLPSAVLATGDYGRRELFPCSNPSFLIVIDGNPGDAVLQRILNDFQDRLVQAGLTPEGRVCRLAQCLDTSSESPELFVSLFDQRLVAGSSGLHQTIEHHLATLQSKHAQRILLYLRGLAALRHGRFSNTARSLEPDVKEGPGGLDDLNLLRWLVPLTAQPVPEAAMLEAAALLDTLRCFLHYFYGSDRNKLTFEAQAQLESQRFPSPAGGWMRAYYEHAAHLFQYTRRALEVVEHTQPSLLDAVRQTLARAVSAEFAAHHDRVLLKNPEHLQQDPAMCLRLAEYVARHGARAGGSTERHLEAAAPVLASYCASQTNLWKELAPIFAAPHAALAVRALDAAGLLPAILPEWGAIENEQARLPGQRFTTGEETLRALDAASALREPAGDAALRFAPLLAELDNPETLAFSLLLAGLSKAGPVMRRLGVPENERATIEFLLASRDALSSAVATRDISDPAAARPLAVLAGTPERLRLLTLFSYARLAAQPAAGSALWRWEQLWMAYENSRRALAREVETDRITEAPADLPGAAEFVRGLPVRYLRSRSQAARTADLHLYEASRPTGAAIHIEALTGAFEVTIIARDRPALFVALAGTLSGFGLEILKAEAFSNAKGVILDSFVFTDPRGLLALNTPEFERLAEHLEKAALGKVQPATPAPPRGHARKPAAPPRISFDAEASEAATLVEVSAADRPGLLYSLAVVFAANACNVDVVLVDTKGNRALDAFYVSRGGQKLDASTIEKLEHELIAAC